MNTANQSNKARNLTDEELIAVTGGMAHREDGVTSCVVHNRWEDWIASNFGICLYSDPRA